MGTMRQDSHRQAPATIVDPQLRNTEEGPATVEQFTVVE